MNNEEQIISMLQTLTTTVETLVNKVDKLEAGQAKLEEGQAKLEASQTKLEAGQTEIIHEVKAIREQTQDLVEFQAETRLNLGKISKKLDAMQRVTEQNTFNIAELQTRAV